MLSVQDTFDTVVAGVSLRIIQFPHPWLQVFAQNEGGHASLLIKADLPAEMMVADARGFSIKTSRESGDQYVRITSDQAGCPPIFAKLASFVLEKTAATDSARASLSALSGAIRDLKRFFSRRPGRLSHDQVQGLFSEIELLVGLVHSGIQIEMAVSAWKGPFSRRGVGLHDFSFPNGYGIEVKSTNQPATEVRVSSATQLVPGDVGLDLVVVPVETTGSATGESASLREAISGLKHLARDSGNATQHIDSALEEFGADFGDEYYDQWRFVTGIWQVYEVGAGFPFMAAEDIPRGIFRVAYSLSLADLSNFRVSVDSFLERLGGEVDG
jgi:hypothetical protein